MMSNDIRNTIVSQLYAHLNVLIIPGDDDAKIPEYPYVVYNTTVDNVRNGQDTISYEETLEGADKTYENLVQATYAFNVHADSRDEASEICYQIVEYFNRIGREKMNASGIGIENVSPIENRSLMLVDHYVRRYGLDVRINYVDTSTYAAESIETINN